MNDMRSALGGWLLVTCCVAGAQPLEFKGVPFGASVAEFKAAHPAFTCSTSSCYRYGFNASAATYAGEMAGSTEAAFDDDKLDKVSLFFYAQSFERIAAAIESKYGPPSSVTGGEFKTRGGLTAAQEKRVWALAAGDTISITRHAGTISEGYLIMHTSGFEARTKKARDEQAQRAKKDL